MGKVYLSGCQKCVKSRQSPIGGQDFPISDLDTTITNMNSDIDAIFLLGFWSQASI